MPKEERKCIVDGCDNKTRSLKMCHAHYFRMRRHGSTEFPLRKKEAIFKDGKSICSSCQEIKLLSDFNVDKHTSNGVCAYCKDCNVIKNKAKYKNNPKLSRNSQLKKNFGINLEQYEKMLALQNNSCAVCMKASNGKKSLAVDHCHKTGKIRGLLCDNCNLGLGKFKDNINMLQLAINYLRDNNV